LSIFTSNFTLQDILGAGLAFCLFPLVIVFPGYVTGWALDLFDFRLRQPIVRLGIGLVLSFAVSPIVLDLTSNLFSLNVSLLTLGGFAAAFAAIILKEKQTSAVQTKRGAKFIFWVGIAWAVFAILSQVDTQWKDQLYFSMVSLDQTMRVSVIDAMTRTGVPPVNPSYYPGHPVQLTFLYYFWYILGSMIDVIGGRYVDARAALNASAGWAGIGLMAIIAFYLRQRNANNTETAWGSARIGIGLLAVSGLDALPIIVIIASIGTILGTVEIWNTVIAAWVDSLLWVPHHVASLIAGLVAMMLAHFARGKSPARQFAILAIAGLGFASAFGLSVWVTLVFVAFWGVWLVALFIQKTERNLIPPMIFAGMLALLLASPFLLGLLQSGGEVGRAPIIFQIREFLPLEAFVQEWSPLVRSLIMLAFLPVNYMLELGFFFMVGIYWFKLKDKETYRSNPYYLAEITMLAVVLLIGSCLRSNVINNDLGWRAWLPGQFILLVWGVDFMEVLFFNKGDAAPTFIKPAELVKTKNFLRVLIVIGILTSTMDAVFQKILWPVKAGLDIGQRSYSARLAYDYLRDHVPAEVIAQNNPLTAADRPSGLYGTHQMVISDRSPYGIPEDVFDNWVNNVGVLFTNGNATDWQSTDRLCREYSIDILIFKDIDPIWKSLATLKKQRPALYENSRYALYACGNYAQNGH
jgi:large-conductance mechanosensitive channel